MINSIKPYSKYVLDAIKSIKQHIDTDPLKYKTATTMLAEICTPNRSAVEQAFKHVYGVRIKTYLNTQRLEASKNFLAEGMSKKQIAAKMQYRSQSSYAAAFKKEFGLTPTAWQLRYAI